MNKPLYDNIGHQYNQFRRADFRLAKAIMSFFPSTSKDHAILEIGCGTGNYTLLFAENNFPIIALDPSAVMLKQCPKHKNIFPHRGTAENLNQQFTQKISAIVAIMSVQHWNNPLEVINNLHERFADAPIILFTFDPRLSSPIWFYDYFPELFQLAHKQFPDLSKWQTYFENHTSMQMDVIPFLIPDDFIDQFAPAQWKDPSAYLDPEYRKATSGFFLLSTESVENSIFRLNKDIKEGAFEDNYGAMLNHQVCDLGFRIVVIRSRTCVYNPIPHRS